MSRITFLKTERFEAVLGVDHVVGLFYQLFDKNMTNETPEGEGLIFDWDEQFGCQTNLTGKPFDLEKILPEDFIKNYVNENSNNVQSTKPMKK